MVMHSLRQLFIMTLLLGSLVLSAKDLYVSPTGTPTGDGSKANPLDLATAVSAKSPAVAGDAILLLTGTYDGPMKDIERVPFDFAVSGEKDKPVKIQPAPGANVLINGAATVTSSYAEYCNLEIGDLQWDSSQKKHKTPTVLDFRGGVGAKFINCNVFGGDMGMGCWSAATNTEIYGCLVHDFGYFTGEGRGHGHAFYTQNQDGTKAFIGNIAYRGFGWNFHLYTEGGRIQGFDLFANISYLVGAQKPGQTMDCYLISGYTPADRIRVIGNIGYQPEHTIASRPDVRLTSYKELENGKAEVKDNYLMGAPIGFLAGTWKDLEVSGNTIWSFTTLINLSRTKPEEIGTAYKVHGNTYLQNGTAQPFACGGKAMDFIGWQAMGLDKDGQILSTPVGRPTGSKVFVLRNKYQPGRANVGIFNWDGKDSIAVDLGKALSRGQSYVVYNCMDIRQTIAMAKPVLTGTYTGSTTAFPMRKDPLSPDFDAFLVLPVNKR